MDNRLTDIHYMIFIYRVYSNKVLRFIWFSINISLTTEQIEFSILDPWMVLRYFI